MKKGTVKWYIDSKGFGFITPDDKSEDLFFHGRSYVGHNHNILREGQKVNFDVESSPKGPKAINIVAL